MNFIYLKTIILGIIVGFIAGVQGNTGAVFILTGLLVLDIVKTQGQAAGIALFYSISTIFAAYQYYTQNKFDLKIVGVLIITSTIFSVLGAKVNPYIPQKYVLYSIAMTTLIASLYFFHRAISV